MHDTCPTANLVPYLVNDLRAISGKLHFGEEEWDALPDDEKPWFDYLCGNHSRNLPLDEWNREYEAYIKDELGEVQKAGDGQTRVEGSGILLLRAMCRLTHMGHKEYAKGDGRRFHDYLQLEYPDVKSRCVGRAEMSKRQDWCAEVSWNFFNLIKPIITFTVAMCAVDANILRDAVLVRLEKELRLANEVEEKAKKAKQHLKKAIKFNVNVKEPLAATSILLHVQKRRACAWLTLSVSLMLG
jgi:hypothetical protein